MKNKKKYIGLSLFVLFIILLPIGVKHAAVYYLTKAGAETVTIEDIDINLFTGNLEIEKFSIKSEQFEPLTLTSAVFNVSMLRLFTGKLLIEQAVIDGLDLAVENYSNEIVIGFPVVSKTSGEEVKEDAPEVEGEEESEPPFGIGNLLFSNSSITYTDEKITSVVDINQVKLLSFYCWKKDTPAVLKIDALLNKAKFDADVVMKPFAETKSIESHIRLNQFKLSDFSGYLKDYVENFETVVTTDVKISAGLKPDQQIDITQSGFVNLTEMKGEPSQLPVSFNLINAAFSYKGDSVITLAPGKRFPVFEVKGTFGNDALNAVIDTDKIVVKHRGLTWAGQITNETGVSDETAMAGDITLDHFSLDGENPDSHIVSFDKMSLNTISVNGKDKASLSSVIMSGVGVATRATEDQSKKGILPLTTKNVTVNNIQLTGMDKLTVAGIEIETLDIPVERRKDGTLPLAEMMKKLSTDINAIIARAEPQKETDEGAGADVKQSAAPPVQPAEEEDSSAFTVQLGSVSLTGTNTVKIRDYNVKPSFIKEIDIEEFALTNISNLNKNDKARLEAKIKTEKHGFIDIKGDVQLFNPKVNLAMKVNVKGVHLAELSPYSASAVGYNIKTGVFNTKADCKIVADKLDVTNDLFVENIILIPNANGTVKKITKQFLMPVDQTLSILRDDDNNVKLSIPVTGDINNPDFHYKDVMAIAMKKAVKSASISVLKNLIQPYGVVITAAEYAYMGKKYLEKIRLDPLMFEPGSPLITPEGRKYLDTIVSLLNKKEELRLSVCGFSTIADLPEIDPLQTPDPFVVLSKTRQSNVIHYMEERGIPHQRLFHCNGDIDVDEEALSRVEMSL